MSRNLVLTDLDHMSSVNSENSNEWTSQIFSLDLQPQLRDDELITEVAVFCDNSDVNVTEVVVLSDVLAYSQGVIPVAKGVSFRVTPKKEMNVEVRFDVIYKTTENVKERVGATLHIVPRI
jgi:hypothetical protein